MGRDDGLGSDPLTAQPRACDLPEPTQGHHILRASQVTRGGRQCHVAGAVGSKVVIWG